MDVAASIGQVWDVLADGWSYAGWVVGASHIRAVDDGWPKPGTRIHHSVGPWPLVIQDSTEIVRCEAPGLLELDARLWPVGAARITLALRARAELVTEVRMTEVVARGPSALLPRFAQDLLLIPRNRESLRRFAALAEGRSQ